MSLLTKAWTPFKHHPVQEALWRCPKRFVAVPAGRGSGKTEMAKRRLIRFLPVRKVWPDPRYFYGAPTRDQAKRIAWQSLKDLIPPSWIIKGGISESALTIETVFGSKLHVVGMDKPQRIEGVQWDGGVIDESCDQKPKVFDLNVLPALSWRNGWCWRIGVPKRQGVGAKEYKDFYDAACNGEIEDAQGFTWPSTEIIPPELLAHAQRTMDPKDYREQILACFETAGGGVFYAFEGDYNKRPCPYHADRPIIVGSDFNVDPMAWVLCHRWPDRIEVFDEIWLRDANTPRALDTLYKRYSSHKGGFEFYGDATGRARKTSASKSDYAHIMSDDRFKALGRSVHYNMANPLQTDRFASTNAMFTNANGDHRMFVDPRCTHLVADLGARYYKPNSREPQDSGEIGHITDALGYIVHKLFPIRIKLEHKAQPVGIRSHS